MSLEISIMILLTAIFLQKHIYVHNFSAFLTSYPKHCDLHLKMPIGSS